MTDSSSLTWTAHVRLLFELYHLPDPLTLLNNQLWTKERWKMVTKSAVTKYHEVSLRNKAATNSKLSFLNVQITGLMGRPHPVLTSILTTRDVMSSRVHIKMLAGDYPCFSYLGSDRNQSPHCRLCKALSPQYSPPEENMVHLLTRCRATTDTRIRFTPELLNTISRNFPNNSILETSNHTHLTQLILDPTSLNLPLSMRISPAHKDLPKVLFVCRNLCYAIHRDRSRQLKSLGIGYS